MPIFPLQDVGSVAPVLPQFQRARQNELLATASQAGIDEFNLNAPVRQAAREGALDAATAQSLMDGALQAMPFIEAQDFNGLLNNVQQRRQTIVERGGDTRHTDEVLGLLQSPNVADQQQGVALITAVATQGQTADQQETFRAATQEELVGLGPDVAGAQISNLTGKFANIQQRGESKRDTKVVGGSLVDATTGEAIFTAPATQKEKEQEIREDANGRLRFVGGNKDTELVFPNLEVTPNGSNNAKDEEGLRKEFTALTKDFNLVSDSFARVKASVEDPSGAGDLALIFNFMKMLDPNSVVRESEFATAQNTGNVPNRIVGLYNRLLSEEGKRLSVEQRNDFTNRANKLLEAARGQAAKTAQAYTNIAERNGVNAQNVIENFTVRAGQTPVPELTEGTVIKLSNGQFQKVVNGELVNVDG